MIAVDRYQQFSGAQYDRVVKRAERRKAIADHFTGVKERVGIVVAPPEVLQPPTIKDWFQISDAELAALWNYLLETASHLSDKGPQIVHRDLNANPQFLTHIAVMHSYVDQLSAIPAFKQYLEKHHLSVNFLHVLVMMHDYGRFVFNGPFPLLYVDGVSDGILRKNFPSFPRQFLHSMKWITNPDLAPDEILMNGGTIEQIPVQQQIGLLLKTIDTLGKFDASQQLLEINTFFNEDGVYNKWIATQVKNNRLPFSVQGGKSISAEQYKMQDERLTRSGAQVIQQLTGLPFSDITALVAQQFKQ